MSRTFPAAPQHGPGRAAGAASRGSAGGWGVGVAAFCGVACCSSRFRRNRRFLSGFACSGSWGVAGRAAEARFGDGAAGVFWPTAGFGSGAPGSEGGVQPAGGWAWPAASGSGLGGHAGLGGVVRRRLGGPGGVVRPACRAWRRCPSPPCSRNSRNSRSSRRWSGVFLPPRCPALRAPGTVPAAPPPAPLSPLGPRSASGPAVAGPFGDAPMSASWNLRRGQPHRQSSADTRRSRVDARASYRRPLTGRPRPGGAGRAGKIAGTGPTLNPCPA